MYQTTPTLPVSKTPFFIWTLEPNLSSVKSSHRTTELSWGGTAEVGRGTWRPSDHFLYTTVILKKVLWIEKEYSAFYLQCSAYYNKWGCGVHTAYWHRDAACCWHQLLQNTQSDFSGKKENNFWFVILQKKASLTKKKPNRFHPPITLHPVRGLTKESSMSSYVWVLSNRSIFPLTFGELRLGIMKLMMFHAQFLKYKTLLWEKIRSVAFMETTNLPDKVPKESHSPRTKPALGEDNSNMTNSSGSSVYAGTILTIRNRRGHLTAEPGAVPGPAGCLSPRCARRRGLPRTGGQKALPGGPGKLRKETDGSLALKISMDARLRWRGSIQTPSGTWVTTMFL